MKTLLFAITLFTSSAFAGSYTYQGGLPLGSCSSIKSMKNIIEIKKQTLEITKELYGMAQTEEDKQKYSKQIEAEQKSIEKSVEFLKYENYLISMSFIFEGEASYSLKYPQTTTIEGIELTNYEIITLNSPFIHFTDESHFVTEIPGSWSVGLKVTTGFICDHPANQSVDEINKQALERVARDFFIKN